RSINEGEATAERISDDSEELARVLTSMDAATVLAGGIDVPTCRGSIPTAGPPAANISTGESNTPKKQRLQEQIDAQVARELEEQQEKENMRMNEQIARDTEVARIHAEEELPGMIDSLDSLPIHVIINRPMRLEGLATWDGGKTTWGGWVEAMGTVPVCVCAQESWGEGTGVLARKTGKGTIWDYYMAMIRNNLGWKLRDFKSMTFEEIEAKFTVVWKHVEDFIPMGSKKEAERLKRKGLNLEHEYVKKQKTSEEAPEIEKSTKEIPEEKIKEMMQLVHVEDVYELETLKLEKDGVDGKLAGLLKASKNLDNLIESQRSDKVKDRVGYNVVLPPAADLYLSLKKDLSWTGLPEFVDDTVTNYSRPSPTVASILAEGQNKNSTTSEDVASPNTPKPFVKFVKPKDSQSESKTNKQETPKKPQVKYAEQYRHSNKKPNVKGNQRNWNNLKSYQLGLEFVLKKNACFNCGDFSHLANECRKRVQRETTRSQNHVYMSLTHRYVGHISHGAPMRPPYRSAGHKPHGPSMNPMRPNMNGARPNRSFFIQAHSYETRSFFKTSVVKTQYRAPWVPTVNKNNPPVNRKFSTGRRNFPTTNRKFPTASRKFPTVPRTTLMIKASGTVAALGT
nr:hypothetical protein [Tanacetum cinerariifolium]